MARITVEDCLNKVDNRFQLIHLAAKRVRQLKKGAASTVVCKNKDIVVALREIAAGNVFQVGKGQVYDQIESPLATGTVSHIDERPLTENSSDLLEPEMNDGGRGEDIFDQIIDRAEEEEDILDSEMDDVEEDLFDSKLDDIKEEEDIFDEGMDDIEDEDDIFGDDMDDIEEAVREK